MICDYGEDHYNASKEKQIKLIKNHDILKEPILQHAGPTVVVQIENGGFHMHGTIIEHGNDDHNGQS